MGDKSIDIDLRLEAIRASVKVIDEWFRKCREIRYCDDADPLLIVEGIYGRVEDWEGLIKSSVIKIAPVLSYNDFKQLLQFIENSGFTVRAVEGAGSEVGVLVSSEATERLEDAVAETARNLVEAGVFDAVRVAVNAMLGNGETYWELVIQKCSSRAEEYTEVAEDSVRAALALINSLNLKGTLSKGLDSAVNLVELGRGLTEAFCVGLRINIKVSSV